MRDKLCRCRFPKLTRFCRHMPERVARVSLTACKALCCFKGHRPRLAPACRLAGCVLLLFLVPGPSRAQFRTLETRNLQLIYYSKGHEYVVAHLARCFENSLQFHKRHFDYTPSERVTVLLQDLGDYGNAAASAVPKNIVSVSISPFNYVYETLPANERMNWLMNHELVHIVTTDKPIGNSRFYRSLFAGKVSPTPDHPESILYSYMTNPRKLSPRWYLEGMAVFMETWMAGGLGRALGAYDEMVFRSMVQDDRYFYDIVGIESEGTKVDFQVGVNAYLYGTRFISYLAMRYGPEKVTSWAAGNNPGKSALAGQFKRVFGLPMGEAWQQWIAWEHQWQQANLDSIRLNPVTPFRPLTDRALGSISRAFYDPESRKIYAAVRSTGQLAYIVALDLASGSMRRLCEVKGPALYYVSSLAYDAANQRIFYTTDNNGWRDLNVVAVATGRSRVLQKDARIGDLAWNAADGTLWGVRHFNGISTIVQMTAPFKDWKQVYSLPYGQDLFDLDISPDGALLVGSHVEISGRQQLVAYRLAALLAGQTEFETLFDFDVSSPESFVFSGDGKFIYGSSYYSGVSNIYRYEIAARDMIALSNCETGFFRPVPVSDDSLIVFRYSGKGFVPGMIANREVRDISAIRFLGNEIVEKHPVVRDWTIGSPARINIDSLTTYRGPYRTGENFGLNSIYPIVEGYKDFAAVGFAAAFADHIGFTGLDVAASYAPDGELPDEQKFHASVKFRRLNWELRLRYNQADFYDLFGPTKRSRKGYAATLQYRKSLIYDAPRKLGYSLKASGYTGLERLPDYQNVTATFDKLLSLDAGLNYEHLRRSLGAVDDETGFAWSLNGHANYVNKRFFPFFYGNLDYGLLLPIDHFAVWLRGAAGVSPGAHNDPFANFFFGGFGNNWVDYLNEKRFRESESFPGVELNSIAGTNFIRLLNEWILPPLRFRHFGFLNFYLTWVRFSLFSTGIVTNLDRLPERRKVLNFGGQLDFEMVLFTRLESTLSLGLARAVEDRRQPENEFMISLKILK